MLRSCPLQDETCTFFEALPTMITGSHNSVIVENVECCRTQWLQDVVQPPSGVHRDCPPKQRGQISAGRSWIEASRGGGGIPEARGNKTQMSSIGPLDEVQPLESFNKAVRWFSGGIRQWHHRTVAVFGAFNRQQLQSGGKTGRALQEWRWEVKRFRHL